MLVGAVVALSIFVVVMAGFAWLEHNRCALHGGELLEDEVPIAYGLFHFSDEYLKQRRKRFPNAGLVSYGGCIVVEHRPTARVRYCPACREAHDAWVQEAGPDAHDDRVVAEGSARSLAELSGWPGAPGRSWSPPGGP